LASKLHGTLVRPNSPQYAIARQLFSPGFDNVLPVAIAYCASSADVQSCLAFARRFSIPVAPRAGGHSYAGYSTTTGMVLDVTRMNTINVNAGAGTVSVGGGTRLIDIYAALTQQGLILPAGSCPSVGVAGLTLGGGHGVLGRKFGLTCDSLLSAQVVLADGRMVTSDASHDPDLFWALRGGGGGNLGVVTSFTFRVYPLSTVSLFTLRWPWSSAAAVVNAWQGWAPQGPDEIWSNCLLETGQKGATPIIQVNGVYVGGVGPLNSLLQKLTSQIGVAPTLDYVSSVDVLDAMLYEAGCYGKTVNECHLPTQDPQGQVQRDASRVKSDYFVKPLPQQGIQNLLNAIERRQSSSTLGNGGIGMDAYGGVINRVAADATAFVHRNILFSAQYSGSWNAGDPASVVAANRSWLNDTWQSMRPYASGSSYQNYVDPDLSDWLHAYYGSNLTRLQHIKATYDPGNFFHFAQSIPLQVSIPGR
jgi:FAD/FMN-containing dehydrogenase